MIDMRMMRKFLLVILAMMAYVGFATAQDASFYLKYAKKGDADAMFKVGECYRFGTDGAPQNINQAVEWWEKAAKKGNAAAQFRMGECYLYGIGVLTDYKKAWDWLSKASRQDFGAALYLQAKMYDEGMYVPKSHSKWWYYVLKAAQAGDDDGLIRVAEVYVFGDDELGIKPDHKSGKHYLEQAVAANSVDALMLQGALYKNGYILDKNPEKAYACFERAALLGAYTGECEQADALFSGNGVGQDVARAFTLYKEAAEEGNIPHAYNMLGEYYRRGCEGVVDVDYKKAIACYSRAVEGEDADALFNLACMYFGGRGVAVNYKKAYELFLKGANLDNMRCVAALGDMYFDGDYVTKDIQKAISNYKKAADGGLGEICSTLFRIYYYMAPELGIRKDAAEAMKWLRKGVDLNDDQSKFLYAVFCLDGIVGFGSRSKGLEMLEDLANEGHVASAGWLGLMYYNGEYGLEKNFDRAFPLLAYCVANASVFSDGLMGELYRTLGACYRFGRGTEVDHGLASYYSEKAAECGDEKSISILDLIR